jgi:hypothetical protein
MSNAFPPEPKRIRQLRASLIEQIPRFPNDRQTLTDLESKPLPSLLLTYINWASRLIPPRPRRVVIEPTLTADARWKTTSGRVRAILERARNGDNLNPYLSLRAHQKGYTSIETRVGGSFDKWEDKDFVLLTLGFHHFHLGEIQEESHAERSDVVLFAQVTRESFNAIAFFDHSVFCQAESAMTPERERMWRIFDQRTSMGRSPGIYLAANPITTSGHSLQHGRLADDYTRLIWTMDAKMDDLQARSEVFSDLPHATVKAMKLRWHLNYLDLGLLDRTTSTFHVFRRGQL